MDTEKLDLFCEIYRDDAILDKFSLIEIINDLQNRTKDLQSIVYNAVSGSSNENINDNDLIFDTIYSLKYDKGANIKYINKWLKEFNINIEDIVKNNLGSNEIGKFLTVNHNDFEGSIEDKRKAHLIQAEFLDYFLKFYADFFLNLDSGFGFNDSNKNKWKRIKLIGLDDEYLNSFCEEISNEKLFIKTSFSLDYEVFENLASELQIEITENILNISESKVEYYLERAISALEKRHNKIHFFKDRMDKWISKFDINLDDFPNFNNEELNIILNKIYSGDHISVFDRNEVFQIQTDFYLYAIVTGTEKLLAFLDKKNIKANNVESMSKTENKNIKKKQLTINQSIILLDKLGLFANSLLEDMQNTNKALLLSQLLGKNEKNIKTAIESLNKKPSELSKYYQTDIQMIENILDSYK